MKYEIQGSEDVNFRIDTTTNKLSGDTVDEKVQEEIAEQVQPPPYHPSNGKRPVSDGKSSQVNGPGGWFEGTSWGR